MINYEKHHQDQKEEAEHTILAVFQSRGEARSAISALHKAKYTHTWLGTTSIAETARGEETLTVESGGFFAGSESLIDALVSHGVTGDVARTLEGRIESGNALLTLNPNYRNVTEATEIITRHGGRIAAAPGASSSDWGHQPWPASAPMSDSDQAGDDEFEEIVFFRR